MCSINRIYTTIIISIAVFSISCEDTSVVNEKEQSTPTVSIVSPLTGSLYFTSDSVNIEVAATDDKGVAKVEIYINGKTDSSKILFVPPFHYKWFPQQSSDSATYSIYAKSYDTDNNIASSKIVYIQVQLIAAPSALKLETLTQTTTELSWFDNSFNEDGFEIYRSSDAVNYFLIKSLTKNITSTIITGENLIKYYYKIRAVSSGKYSAYSNILSVNQFNDPFLSNNIFPLIAGHRFEYTGYFTHSDTETPIAGSSSFYGTSWTLSGNTQFSAVFGTTHGSVITANNGGKTGGSLVFDTTLIASGGPKKFTPIFMYYDSVNADYYYMTNLGLFFRSSLIKDSAAGPIRKDSLRYIKLASSKAGIGGEFMSFSQSFISYVNPSAPTAIILSITGKWDSKTDITVNSVKFSTYYLVVSRTAKVGTVTVSGGVIGKFWFSPDVGPVKMFLAGDAEAPGHYRELKSKNF